MKLRNGRIRLRSCCSSQRSYECDDVAVPEMVALAVRQSVIQ